MWPFYVGLLIGAGYVIYARLRMLHWRDEAAKNLRSAYEARRKYNESNKSIHRDTDTFTP